MAWRVTRAAPLEDITGRCGNGGRDRREPPYRGALPDPTDPATLGCLLAIMYEAEAQHVTPNPVSVGLSQYGLTDPRTADAIIAAILAAPPPGPSAP